MKAVIRLSCLNYEVVSARATLVRRLSLISGKQLRFILKLCQRTAPNALLKIISLALILIASLAAHAYSQGREDSLAKEAYAEFHYHPEGYYRAYLEIIRETKSALPVRGAVSVIGHVEKPGAVAFWEKLTVPQAIKEAGAFKEFADSRHVGVWRCKHGQFIIFDWKTLKGKNVDSEVILLEEGDIIVVLEKRISF